MAKPAPHAPTPMQALILWAILLKGREVPQKLVMPTLTKPDRDALVALRLIKQRTGPRRAVLVEATDNGWAWAAANTAAPLSKSTAAAAILQAVLEALGAHLRATGATLADVLSPPTEAPPPAAADLGARLRDAYLAETHGSLGRRARLAAIRHRMHDVPRDALDAALLALVDSGAGVMMPLDDPRQVTAEDRAAALSAGNAAWHLLLLER